MMLMALGIGMLFFILLMLILSIVIEGIFLYLGCKIVNIKNATLLKSIIAVIAGKILSFIAFLFIEIVFLGHSIGIVIGIIMGIFVYIYVIKSIFDTSWGKAFLAWIIAVVVEIVIIYIISLIFAVSIYSFTYGF
ncbi:hypothetical protein [Methanocaldococcus sp.]